MIGDDSMEAVTEAAIPLTGAATDHDALLELARGARFVLLGEASHGTHDFYRERAHITRRLIAERGFTAVAAEADWPDAYRVARWVRGLAPGGPAEALAGFTRFPIWMWRNTEMLDFACWLREHNRGRPADATVGFWGLDLYSLYSSIEAVLGYLDRVDSAAAARVRRRYGCLEQFGEDTQAYGYAASLGLAASCEDEVVSALLDIRRRAAEYAARDGRAAEEDFFYAEQNARLVKNAEAY